MVLSYQNHNEESTYPLSKDEQYEEALHQFVDLCSKHKVSKKTACSFLHRLSQEIFEMSVIDYDNKLADSGYQKKPHCYFHFVDDPNTTHFDADIHTVCVICAAKLWEIAGNYSPFEFTFRNSRVVVMLIDENALGTEDDG